MPQTRIKITPKDYQKMLLSFKRAFEAAISFFRKTKKTTTPYNQLVYDVL